MYDSAKQLRYGHLMIMTDQDHDGSHIKGLIMNFFHHFYPTLLQLPGFLLEFITPIVKVLFLLSQCFASAQAALLRTFCKRINGNKQPAGASHQRSSTLLMYVVGCRRGRRLFCRLARIT